jgi:hypothetical protein
MKARFVYESLNEISGDLFKSALKKTGEYGQHNRGYSMGSNFFRKFKGLELMGGIIKEIGATDSDGLVIQITLDEDKEEKDKRRYMAFYKVDKDEWEVVRHNDWTPIESKDINRRDARILSQIALMVNPDSKYKNINKSFNIDSSYYK